MAETCVYFMAVQRLLCALCLDIHDGMLTFKSGCGWLWIRRWDGSSNDHMVDLFYTACAGLDSYFTHATFCHLITRINQRDSYTPFNMTSDTMLLMLTVI